MHRFVLALVASAALSVGYSQIATAADMPVKAPVYKAEPAAVVAASWTGFYIGGHIGGAWSRNGDSFGQGFVNPVTTGSPRLPFDTDGSGWIGGAQVGFNWQMTPMWVVGIEASYSKTHLEGSQTYSPIPPGALAAAAPSFITMSRDVKWLADLRGRLGYSWNHTLLYVTGGVAWSSTQFDANNSRAGGAFQDPASVRSTKSGWVAGGGLDHMLSANWTVRAQYLYYSFSGISAVAPTIPLGGPPFSVYSWGRTRVHSATVGVNYKF